MANFFNCFGAIVSQLDRGENFLVKVFFFPATLPASSSGAANSALVLSLIICRSNSAKRKRDDQSFAPKMLKTNLPPLVVVSIASVKQANKPNFSGAKVFNQCQQIFERSSQPIEPPYNQGIALAKLVETLI